MTTITVIEDWQADAVAAMAEAAVDDMTMLWQHVEKKLPEEQSGLWEKGIRRPLASATVQARRKRKGYYGKNAPTGGVGATGPRLKWTGNLKKSTEKFTGIGKDKAFIDADRNYKGPLPYSRPWDQAISAQVTLPGGEPWDVRSLDNLVDKALEDWLEKDILPVVARKAKGIR